MDAALNALSWGDLSGIVSLAVAAATLIVVLVQERRFRRRVRAASWSAALIGYRGESNARDRRAIVKIEQNGSHMVELLGIWFFNTAVVLEDEYRIKGRVFRPGDTVELLFEPEDTQGAWALIAWLSLEDRFEGRMEWLPLSMTGPLADKHQEQQQQEAAKPRRQRARRKESYMLRRVGPDHSLFRRSPVSMRAHRRLGQMAQEVLQKDIQGSTGAHR